MTICMVCGNEEFECDSGLYYCTVCQTQSQGIRDEVAEEGSGPSTRQIRLPRLENKEPGRKRRVWQHGRPWQTHEAWTLILKQQIQALKELGADPKIDSVWKRLWFQYLAKIGVAFCTPEEKETAKNNSMIIHRQRDTNPATLSQPVVFQARKWKTVLRHGRTLGKHMARRIKDEQEVQQVLDSEDFYEEDHPDEDDPHNTQLSMIRSLIEDSDAEDEDERPWLRKSDLEEDEDQENEDEDDENGVRPDRTRMLPATRTTFERHPSYMTLQRTMSFLYLSVMHTNPLTMPHDLIRWIERSAIPFNEAAARLPDDMQFSSADTRTFSGMHPYNEKQLRNAAGRLASFIGVRELPSPDLQHLASRYIMELSLPGELHHLVVELISKNPPNPRRDVNQLVVPAYAPLAMSYIVLILKLLFGLDDHTERELSVFAQEVNNSLHSDHHQLFVWSDWVSAQEATGNSAPWSDTQDNTGSSMQDVVDVGSYLQQHFPESRSDLERRKTQADYFTVGRIENFDGKKRRIKESLSAIAQRLKKSDTSATNTRSTNFSRTTLSYVTDGVSFLENINQLGLSGDTIQSSTCLESSDSEEDMDEYTYTSSQDMFNTPCKRKRTETRATWKRRRGVVRNVVQSSLRQNKQELDTESLAQKLVNALEHYHRNKTITEEREKKHRAYERVVNVCASQIGMLGEELEYYVQRMELVYVRERGSLALRSKKIRSRFTRNFL